MKNLELVERAKMYLKLLCEGVHPVTGALIPMDSAFADEKVKRCFEFIIGTLDEYSEMAEKIERLECENAKLSSSMGVKREFTITEQQSNAIKLSKEPLSVMAFMKNVNSVIDSSTTEKLSSTRINKWLAQRGFVTTDKIQTIVNKTVYKPSEFETKIGIIEEETVDKKSGEVISQIKLSESAQLFIIENLDEIIRTTK